MTCKMQYIIKIALKKCFKRMKIAVEVRRSLRRGLGRHCGRKTGRLQLAIGGDRLPGRGVGVMDQSIPDGCIQII